MSSDDSGFDKEAEREKLREKYERDEKDRENTRRMSELLLQGATMTGKHCNECGDPIFRYDGQEFCPTCQHGTDASAQEQAQADSDGQAPRDASAADSADSSAESADSVEQSADRSAEPADRATDDEPRVEIDGVRVADRHVDRSNVRRPPSEQSDQRASGNRHTSGDRRASADAGRAHEHDHAGRERAHAHAPANGRDPERAREPARTAGDDAANLATARESLVRKLTALAREAEGTDDVARSRDLLAATREAAEALAALDRANR
ncbi:Sjogren's syndrome/scleroderma autoantigen 1 family protein [Halorussus caseinilyticus]|uniref:Sjogren's syndrome/scleroderma autoantigen 1 family protein n=1 Tax=Halorussus caseinilyticus TaxID=3034025 RepID=UPI0023E8DD35|nr:Sjogren's syndrome/scleroderma autoantigen 1 family protein [Halorussus sp. DT72]